ncbi:hypothetical protein Dda_6426 [Drechslerella dactyloides]|uniref:RTA1 domain protein n=1 Tax=Drechslerella dactyloides TaxID=74499 RepID=A0AAD6NG69_DREDA|nr:hypothetical protein Dda_6426 [Drechslerella dactyloides]
MSNGIDTTPDIVDFASSRGGAAALLAFRRTVTTVKLETHFQSPDSTSTFLYCPSLPAAALFAALFGLSALTHIFQAFYHRKLRLCWVIILGATWEAVAFGLRSAATQNPLSDGLGIPSQILIYLSPLLVNAFAYMVLGRMVWYYLEAKRVFGVSATRLTVIFVWLDIIAFLVQLVGASMASARNDDPNASQKDKDDAARAQKNGLHIYMGGIGFQLFWILVFSAVAWRFRMKAVMERVRGVGVERETNWRHLLAVLYFTLLAIVIRIIFRLVEFSGGEFNNNLTTHEVFFYVLEATPMFMACLTWNIFHPGRFLVGPDSEFPRLSRKEKKALKAEKKRVKQEEKQAKEEREQRKRWKLETKMARRGGESSTDVEMQ